MENAWGLQREVDVLHTGYKMPQLFIGLICRYVLSLSEPILDVGVRTGILGRCLTLLGYETIEALHRLDVTVARPVADTLRELTRVTAPGGCLAQNIREDEYLTGEYKDAQERFESSGRWQ